MKKSVLYDRAEFLYVEEQRTFESIAEELDCSDRTIRNWAKEGRWELKRKRLVENRESLHDDVRDIARLLAEKIKGQLQDDKIPAAHMMNAFTRIASTLLEARKYEKELDSDLADPEADTNDREAALAKFRETFGVDLITPACPDNAPTI